MGVKVASTKNSSDKENWDEIFKALVKMLHTKQDQLVSLVKDRNLIENSIKNMEQNWISDVRFYQDQLSLMKNEIETMKMILLVESSKSNLLSGSKERDNSLYKLKLEQTMDELNDFKAWFDFLTVNTNTQKESDNDSDAATSNSTKSLEAEIQKLKLDYGKLASEKRCEVFDLVRENGFAWSQFKCIEKGFTDKLKRKYDEVAKANTKISSLLSYQEELQSSNQEKDETISKLKAKIAELEMGSSKKDEEISKLSRDLESLKKSRSFTPVLTRCTTREKGNTSGSLVSTKKESTPSEQGSKYPKRKRASKTPVSVPEIPKLFTSSFRVPKLKSPSSGAI